MPGIFGRSLKRPGMARAFPKMRIARDTEDGVYTSLKGFRQATSIGGSLTGMGGDTFIIDDPLKPARRAIGASAQSRQ